MSEKKSNILWYFGGAVVVILLIVAGLSGAFNSLLSFAAGCKLPASIFSAAYFNSSNPNSGGLNVASCGLSNTNITYYGINYETGFVSGIGTLNAYSTVYVALSTSSVNIANSQNQGQITASKTNQTNDNTQAQETSGISQQGWQAKSNAEAQVQAVLSAAINYNNKLVVSTTTTIPATCQGTNCVSVAPPSNILNQWWTTLSNFFASVYKFLITPYALSISTNPANFTVSQPFTTKVSLAIPAQWQTKNTTTSSGKNVQQTYCSYFVTNNQSVNLVNPQPTPILVQGGFYNTSFSFTPSSPQILVVGSLCRSDNVTYSYASGQWGQWSNWVTVANQSVIAKQGVTSLVPNPISGFFQGLINWFENLFKGL